MTNKQMLDLVRQDRPDSTINKVLSFSKNKYDFYDVKVDMEVEMFGTIVKHAQMVIPYPISEYNKMSEESKEKYQFQQILSR